MADIAADGVPPFSPTGARQKHLGEHTTSIHDSWMRAGARRRPRTCPGSVLVVRTLRAQRARCTRRTWSRCQAERASELVEKTLLRGARVRGARARGVPWHARLTD